MADPNVFAQLVRPVRSVADYSADLDRQEANRLALQGQRRQNALQDAAFQQQVEKRNALQRVVAGWSAGTTDEERSQSLRGNPLTWEAAGAFDKSMLERGKAKASAAKDQAEADKIKLATDYMKRDRHLQGLASVTDPQQAAAWIGQGVQLGEFSMGQAQQVIQGLQSGQIPLEQWKQRAQQGGMTLQQQAQDRLAQITQTETARHNQATEANTVRGQDITAATAAAGRTQAERHFQAGQNTPQYMQTDAGLVALPKKVAQGQQPTATVITGPNGESLGKPLKDIPANANTAIITNSQNLARIDQALKLLDGKNIGELKGDKAATGVKGYLPQGLLNRADSRGIDTRAMIADLGSMVIHDRSGAAVTAAESPRLMPFIPLITDSADTATKKLKRFKQVYEQEQQALNDTYSKAQGYRPNPVANGGGTPARTSSGATTSNW